VRGACMRAPLAEPWQAYAGLERLSTFRDASDAEAIVWLDIDNTLYSHMETRYARCTDAGSLTAWSSGSERIFLRWG